MLISLLRPAAMLDSTALVRMLGPTKGAGEWEKRRLATVKTTKRVTQEPEERTELHVPFVPWFCTAFTREELWGLSAEEITTRLRAERRTR